MPSKKTRMYPTLLFAAGLSVGLLALPSGCVVRTGGSGSGYTRSYVRTTQPTLRIVRFRGRHGVIRIHNTTRYTLRRVTVGVRGFGCNGARPTRTMIRTFNVFLQPGYWKTYSFTFGAYCRRVRAATVAR